MKPEKVNIPKVNTPYWRKEKDLIRWYEYRNTVLSQIHIILYDDPSIPGFISYSLGNIYLLPKNIIPV